MGRNGTRLKGRSKSQRFDIAVLVVRNDFIRFGHFERLFCGGYLISDDLVAWICSILKGLEIRLIHGSWSWACLNGACFLYPRGIISIILEVGLGCPKVQYCTVGEAYAMVSHKRTKIRP